MTRSTVPAPEEGAIAVASRRHALPPLDDRPHALRPAIPHLTRSSLRRCLERHGIGRLPEVEGGKAGKERLADHPLGHLHIDVAEVGTEEGKLRLFVAIDRTSGFAFARLVESAGEMEAARFPREPVEAVPCRVRAALTDDGVRFATGARDVRGGRRVFGRVREGRGVERRPTGVDRPWTDGRGPPRTRSGVERTGRTLKGATVERRHYGSRDRPRAHLRLSVDAHDHARRLETPRGPRPTGSPAEPGRRSPSGSGSTRHTTPRDHAPPR